MPSITIITPVLNQVETVERCILSVARQNVDVEHIVIDGGSTDGTVEIIRSYENNLAFWASEKDRGQSDAINKGLKLASGLFFNWLNADDLLTENALQTVLGVALSGTHAVIGKCEHIDMAGNLISAGSARIWDSLEGTLGNYSMGQPSQFYRTEIVKELGGLNTDLHYCMDMDLWLRYLLKHGQEHLLTTEAVLSRFTVRPDAKSERFRHEMTAEKYALYHALLSNFELPPVLERFFPDRQVPRNVYSFDRALDRTELLANFSWHLMVKAYEEGDRPDCQAYFDIVKKGRVLSPADRLKWKARISAMKWLRR